ncbi:MAG: TetR/AcrR family transcriptional regulator [Candidatus Acidiferrales bacterium]
MASPAQAPIRPTPLQSQDWIRAASVRFSQDGLEAVRIELLARDLGVSKGSFYWHFRDREDLLNSVLADWEREEIAWLHEASTYQRSPAARWAKFVERASDSQRTRFEAALRGWARRDERIAARVASIEKERALHIAGVLREVGFTGEAADTWSELALLVYLGWLDRATRDTEFRLAGPGLGEFLSQLVLAASTRTPKP